MPVSPVPQEQIDRYQADLRLQVMLEAPAMGNLEAATTLHDDGVLLYRGRQYRTRATPYRTGLWLQALMYEFRQLTLHEPTTEVLQQSLRVLTAAVGLMWGLVRWPWSWRHGGRNPFLEAELGEVQALADFFSPARMTSPVLGLVSHRAPPWLRSTSLTNSPASPIGIRAGWRRTATPVVTAISRSA
jgi:hypothetical protein